METVFTNVGALAALSMFFVAGSYLAFFALRGAKTATSKASKAFGIKIESI